MKKDIAQYLPCEKFIVKKLLSHGSYGIVYLAYSHIQHQTVAVKVEKNPRGYNHNPSNLQREIYNLEALSGIQGVPQVLDYDCEKSQYSYFSMQMLGKDFSQLLKKCNNKFTNKTVLMVASQVINILQLIHERGYIHRDIKPENLVLGRGQDRNKVYIIDFGTAKSYIDKTTKNHIPFQEKQQFVGTYRYASKAPHFGFEQGRKDDLESLGYVLIYLCKGRLPWQDLREQNQGSHSMLQKTIGQMKQDITIDDLCEELPSFFHWYMNYVNDLKFDEEPQYDLIIQKINDCMQEELKYSYDNEFDWSGFSINQSYVCLSNQDAASMYSSINNYNSINNSNQPYLQGLQSSNLIAQGDLNKQNNNSLTIPMNDKTQNVNQNINSNQKTSNSSKLKTFNKSKSTGVQNTQIQSFEENYSRQVHCEDFDDDLDEENDGRPIQKSLSKQLPYLFNPKTRQKQNSEQINKSGNNQNRDTNYHNGTKNGGVDLNNDFFKLKQNILEQQNEDLLQQSRNYQKSDTNDHINNTSKMLQNITINISSAPKVPSSFKKQYINEPIQEDNITQENQLTIESFFQNQEENNEINQGQNMVIENNSIYTTRSPRFISQYQCTKEANKSNRNEINNNNNVLKAQLS